MHLDVVDLRSFYYRTKLGRMTKHVLQEALERMWPDTRGQVVAGYGFAVPLLRPFLGTSERVISLMPGQQGVMPWPQGRPNLCCLVEETQWPIVAGTVDRLVIAHGLETCDNPNALFAEIWRVLSPGGSVIFVVPNRAGLWARRDGTPFGYGRPYSVGQLETQLRRHRFIPDRHVSALYTPPSQKRFWLRASGMLERFGRRFGVGFGAGAHIVEATKQIYVKPKGGAAEAIKRPLEVLEGLTHPGPKPEVAGRGGSRRDQAAKP